MLLRITRSSISILLGIAAGAAACDNATTPSSGANDADLKLVHASANVGAVDVDVGGQTVITGLTYGNSSALTRVTAGAQRVRVRHGATTIAEVDAMLSTVHVNALTLTDDTVQVSTTVTPDTGQAISNRANIRLINVVGESTSDPTLLYALINAPGVSPDSVARIGMDTKIASHGSLMYFDPGHFRFRFAPQANVSNVLADVDFDVVAGQKRAVVLRRDAGGVYHAEVVAEP
jgi:Domain of unknown function (DUF4397)